MIKQLRIGSLAALLSVLTLCLATAAVLQAAEPPPVPPLTASTTPTLRDDWVQLHESMVADAKARADKIQIVLVGDSITRRWTTGAGREFYAKRYEPVGAINLGISADGTQHVLWRLQHGVLDGLHPKMALIMIGTNNLARSEPPAVANGVWAIVEQIRRTHPETRVLVEGIFPRLQADLNAKIPAVNQLLAKLDDGKMVKYIDFGKQFLLADGSLNQKIFTDGTHPEDPEGFRIWADAVQPTVDEWLKTPPVLGVPPPAKPAPDDTDLGPVTPEPRSDWLNYHHKRFVDQAAKGKCDLLFFGDAVMNCWGRAEPLFKKEYGAYKPLNFSIFGNRTENILYQLANGTLGQLKPRLAVVQVQDNLYDTPAKNVAAGMAAIVKLIREQRPETKVLLLGAFPVGAKPTDPMRAKVIEYNALLEELADGKGVFFFDPGKTFPAADGTLERGATPSQNPFTLKAYEKWADVQRETIATLMAPAITPK